MIIIFILTYFKTEMMMMVVVIVVNSLYLTLIYIPNTVLNALDI